MRRTLFDICRESVSAHQAAEFYGVKFGRNGRAHCPWHDDTHPDLAFYEDGTRCYCHACHNGGDAVALVGQLFDLPPLEAARKINADFRLGHPGEAAPVVRPSRAYRRKALNEWRRQRWTYLSDVEREARAELERAQDWDSPRFAAVLRSLARAQDELDFLQRATPEELEAMLHG